MMMMMMIVMMMIMMMMMIPIFVHVIGTLLVKVSCLI